MFLNHMKSLSWLPIVQLIQYRSNCAIYHHYTNNVIPLSHLLCLDVSMNVMHVVQFILLIYPDADCPPPQQHFFVSEVGTSLLCGIILSIANTEVPESIKYNDSIIGRIISAY